MESLFLSRKLASCSPKARNYSRQDTKGHLAGRSYNSPRDKKRHIQYVGLSKFWGVFSYPVELWSCSPKARNYSRQDAKGHLAGRSYNSPRDKKRHIQYVGLSKFWGVFSYPVELWSCSPKARNYSRQDAKGHLTHRSYSSNPDSNPTLYLRANQIDS